MPEEDVIKTKAESLISECLKHRYYFLRTRGDVYGFKDDSYPQIIFPESFLDALRKIGDSSYYSFRETIVNSLKKQFGTYPAGLNELQEPYKPKEPVLSDIPKTHKVFRKRSFWEHIGLTTGHFIKNLSFTSILYGICFGGGPAFFVICVVWDLTKSMDFAIICGAFIILIAIIIADYRLFGRFSHYPPKCSEVEIKYTEDELKRFREKEEERFNLAKERYPEEVKKYKEDLKEYEDKLEKQVKLIDKYYLDIMPTAFSQSEKFSSVNEGPQRGRSEDKLFAELMKMKDIHIYYDTSNISQSIHIDKKIAGYFPDLTISTSNDVLIDVEIDEPYEMGTRKEIHYIGCEDDTRNKKISEKNWVIIRFSEKQVLTKCDKCVELILTLKMFIETGAGCVPLQTLRNSIKESRWTKEEARFMAINNYRDTY